VRPVVFFPSVRSPFLNNKKKRLWECGNLACGREISKARWAAFCAVHGAGISIADPEGSGIVTMRGRASMPVPRRGANARVDAFAPKCRATRRSSGGAIVDPGVMQSGS